METARLLLLSKSGRFPNGLANGSDLVGRNVTFHEYSAAVGTYADPVYAWAGGGYVSASTFQHYEHDPSRGFVSGGHIAVAGVGIPLPINWRLPGAPTWGAEAKKIDREDFSHSLAVAMVLHDMPQHDNRIDLDDKIVDAWGLPVDPRDAQAAPNDLDQGRYLIDRGADILEASGARTITKVYADARHRQLLAPARHSPHGRRSRTRPCSTAGVARTRWTTSTRSTARPSRPAPAPTRPSPSWPTPGGWPRRSSPSEARRRETDPGVQCARRRQSTIGSTRRYAGGDASNV